MLAAARASPARASPAKQARASQRWRIVRMTVFLCGEEGNSLFPRVRKAWVGEKLLVGQRFQEGKERGLLGVREVQPPHPRVEVGVRLNFLAVVVQHLLEGGEPPVVHVGS